MSRLSGYCFLLFLTLLSAPSPQAAPGRKPAPDGKNFTLVVDPGHGGKDPGAVGRRGREKDVVLAVAKKLKSMVEDDHADVRVIATRETDVFVGLQERADIANRAGSDLFVSLHCNSVAMENPKRTTVEGTSVYAAGVAASETSLRAAQRENAVMVLEPDYSTKYEGFDPELPESYILFDFDNDRHMLQSLDYAARAQARLVSDAGRANNEVRQAGFWVLKATTMPAVLVELDFICNPAVEDYLLSEQGQTRMARALADAFTQYKDAYDRHSRTDKGLPSSMSFEKSTEGLDSAAAQYKSPPKKQRKPGKKRR